MSNNAAIQRCRFFLILFISLCLWAIPVVGKSKPILSKGQTVYVPVYSHIYSGDRDQPFHLATTLSIRNTNMSSPIILLGVDYYDSEGNRLKQYLDKPLRLRALSTIRYIIKESDKSGGSGAKFIVKWKSETEVNSPIIETVMISTRMNQGISFVSRGQVIDEMTH